MARETFTIEGLSELEDALKELPRSAARTTLLRTIKKGGQIIADAGQQIAPRLTGGLAQSYQVNTKLSRRQKSKNRKQSDVEVYVGPTSHAKSVQTEFGNAHQAAEPHLRPAWDGNVQKVLAGIRDDLADELERTRLRLARKAERLAAKMGR